MKCTQARSAGHTPGLHFGLKITRKVGGVDLSDRPPWKDFG
jgi:hypothetical protein